MGADWSRRAALAVAALLALASPAAAQAGVLSAETVLPPGQSGFVPPDGQPDNPHLDDQIALFEAFAFKPAGFDQPGSRRVAARRRDDHARRLRRAERPGRIEPRRLVRRGLRRRPGPPGRARAVPARKPGPPRRGAGREPARVATSSRAATTTRAPSCAASSRALPEDLRDRFGAYADGVNAWMARVAADPALRPRELALLGLTPARWTALDSAAIGAQLARTVPSDDGHELENWRALRALGAKRFAELLPLRQRGEPVTVPASEGRFPSQPGRSRGRRAARLREVARVPGQAHARPRCSRRVRGARRRPARTRRLQPLGAARPRQPGRTCSPARSWASRSPSCSWSSRSTRRAWTCAASPRPGIPVIAAGHNAHIAWGITSGLDDDDDLYVERLRGKERYRFKGRTRKMRCRTERFAVAGAKTVSERFCRTVHGPVQMRQGSRHRLRAPLRDLEARAAHAARSRPPQRGRLGGRRRRARSPS